MSLSEQTEQSAPTLTEEKENNKPVREYLSPKAMAAYIISGIGDKNWETFSGHNGFSIIRPS